MQQGLQKFIFEFFGTADVLMVFVGWLYAMIGVFVSLLIHTTQRNPSSQRTPEQFSWKFLFKDNAARIISSMLLVFVCLRFSSFLGIPTRDDIALTGFMIGFGLDKIVELWKNKK